MTTESAQNTTIQFLMEEIREHLYQSNYIYRQKPGEFMVLVDEKTGACVKITIASTDEKVNWEE